MATVVPPARSATRCLPGDYPPVAERGRSYAYIVGGEATGSAAGYVVSGLVASLLGWRAAFLVRTYPTAIPKQRESGPPRRRAELLHRVPGLDWRTTHIHCRTARRGITRPWRNSRSLGLAAAHEPLAVIEASQSRHLGRRA